MNTEHKTEYNDCSNNDGNNLHQSAWEQIRTPQNYAKHHKKLQQNHDYDMNDKNIMQNEFPSIEMDNCLIVTDKNVYCIELRHLPHVLFLNLAADGQWKACEEFCLTFNLNFNYCIEYAGDVFLKRKKLNQALVTYSSVKVKCHKLLLSGL